MLHFFRADPDQIRWKLAAIESGQSCMLAARHSQGMSVEYFKTVAMAITRVQDLENLPPRARGLDDPAPAGLH